MESFQGASVESWNKTAYEKANNGIEFFFGNMKKWRKSKTTSTAKVGKERMSEKCKGQSSMLTFNLESWTGEEKSDTGKCHKKSIRERLHGWKIE